MIGALKEPEVTAEPLRDPAPTRTPAGAGSRPEADLFPWPKAPEDAMRYLQGLPDEEIDKITHLNAMRNFSFDPFAHIPREQCTVGALRALATDVDTTPVSHGTGKFQESGLVTAMTLAERMAAQTATR